MIGNRKHGLCRTRLGVVGLALVLAHLGPGCATAETYRSGGSTAVIEQSGGSGRSRSEVTVYPDGQRIVTRNGNSTDVTVQRGPGASATGGYGPPGAFDWPDQDWIDQRFSPRRTVPGGSAYLWDRPDLSQEAFRRRMLKRMRISAPY